ncbi:MAG: HAD hydrolase-like protein [Actinobacteria bacterium]|nr:HAD hydrolase-like protein [Actinomycetota bacterium]
MSDRRRDSVLFDLDGVLVDSRAAISGCINHALVEHGHAARPPEDLYAFIGPALADGFAALTGEAPGSALVAACVASYRDRYAEASLRETTAVPGIEAALAELAPRHTLAVATSKPLAFAAPILETLGLRPFFAAVAGPDLDAHREGKATTIAAALALLDHPDRAVMVGDRSFDVAGARANSLPAIGVTWGIGGAAELREAGADAIVERPADLAGTAAVLLQGNHPQRGAPQRSSRA